MVAITSQQLLRRFPLPDSVSPSSPKCLKRYNKYSCRLLTPVSAASPLDCDDVQQQIVLIKATLANN